MGSWTEWVMGGIPTALFALFATVNAMVLYKGTIKGEKVGSGVPFLGGIFGAIGFTTLPVPLLNQLFWLPLILDVGCLPGLIYFAFWWVFLRGKENRKE